MDTFLEMAALYAGTLITLVTAVSLIFKVSGSFSSWISTKIVQNADMSKRIDHISKEEFNKSICNIMEKLEDINEIRLTSKRLEYLNMRQHTPEDMVSINMIYDEYKKLGGNSYIDRDYERWAKETSVDFNKKSKTNGREKKSA